MRVPSILTATALVAGSAHAFYLPGVAPTSFEKDQRVPLNVNSLTPSLSHQDDQIHAVVAYDYYHSTFRFCKPEKGPQWVRESLGSIIFGDRIRTSPFELHMGRNETCKSICDSRAFDEQAARFVRSRISEGYLVNILVDGLPGAEQVRDGYTGEVYSSPGFPLGRVTEQGDVVLNNHWDIVVDYHRAGLRGGRYRVVGVLVQAHSDADARRIDGGKAECGNGKRELLLNENGETKVTYTYSVYWRESKTAWATRWDKYFHVEDPKIHWFSLINSTIFVVFLLGMVSTILLRALRKDIARYNRLDNINLDDLSGTSAVGEDDIQEDSGWKLVHGDVFRSPRHALLLSVLLGSGAQLFLMVGFTVLFAMLGFLSPSNRGFLTTVGLLLYTIFGFVGGYVSARSYKTFGGELWKVNMATTPLLVPGTVFGLFFLMNLMVWAKGSSGAVPLSTMLALIGIWFVISVPLSLGGSWFGFKQPAIEPPTRVNQIPRQIPQVSRSLSLWPSIMMTGVLPFCAIFVELYFIMTSLWSSRIYYMFGFLFVVYGLMVLTTACTTVLLVYFMLCAEDYRWQWRAFVGSGMTGVYVFVNALGFWAMKISFGGMVGTVLYVGYCALIGGLVGLLCGTIGFFAAFFFSMRIYKSIKID
ncbi:Transmembrane 9 superfamily member 2 [Cyphellophora attinorum]|uniref:Transmembrane 9 superfamily member n=1 Tax=Cyphellophora attinorum TaxID=1664694 RepID=A0A0N0NHP0_9EURO|nr:Transmembrane 9 superfamily member 2 [Phialophora attinorum]KPI34788.1 Transmembrane 9 superfamily member 2 [Phialophora attinorum]